MLEDGAEMMETKRRGFGDWEERLRERGKRDERSRAFQQKKTPVAGKELSSSIYLVLYSQKS